MKMEACEFRKNVIKDLVEMFAGQISVLPPQKSIVCWRVIWLGGLNGGVCDTGV